MLSSKCMAELGWRQIFILFKFTNLTQCFKIITWKFYLVSTNLHNVWPSDIVQSQNGPKLKLARTQAKCTEGPFWTQLEYTEGPFWTKLECTEGPFWLSKAVWAEGPFWVWTISVGQTLHLSYQLKTVEKAKIKWWKHIWIQATSSPPRNDF